MKQPFNVVVLNGSPQASSRTRVLLATIVESLGWDASSVDSIALHELVQHIGGALLRDDLPLVAQEAFDRIESADLLLVGCPVYRAGIPGLFKHLFDLVDMSTMKGKRVLLAATGGSDRHTLVIDHHLRPLFAFFQALVLPVGVYAGPTDIISEEIVNPALRDQIALAAAAASPWLPQRDPVMSEVAA
ncbi:MAG TPA: NAD(P)H-dependent oxidoreductase [Burkholderiaceae bacterium]|nr:NAD(P)H-dependent oxidoreductase [Burkholderiaceae bacterium]